jgi:hypothetical protein
MVSATRSVVIVVVPDLRFYELTKVFSEATIKASAATRSVG